MTTKKKIAFNLVEIANAFALNYQKNCEHLTDWMDAKYELTEFEQKIMEDTHKEIMEGADQMNEEELKVRLIAPLFYVAKLDEASKIRVFYERPLSDEINEYSLSVITDCLVASPVFNLPEKPYFFLQEFKKAKGEKKDPEAQMLVAMLIAQHKNKDGKPIYGAYLIGTSWHFATLIGQNYCLSPKLEATNISHLLQIVFMLKKLKVLILNR